MSRAFTDNINSFNVSNNIVFTASDDESKILAWLSPLEPHVRHQDICNQRVEGIGGWLLETKEFRDWYNGSEKGELDHASLFCYGDPGGRQELHQVREAAYVEQRILLLTGRRGSSVVVDYLCDQAVKEDMAVACFYYDFASRKAQSPTNMLGSLLKQILSRLGEIPVEITQKFRSEKQVIGGRRLQVPDIVKMFPTVSSLQPTFICVDAIDECIPKHRMEVLDALGQILRGSPSTRIFMTGRPHIRSMIERGLGGRATSVSIKPRDNDIVTYLRARLRKDTTPEVMDSSLEDDIMKRILEEISESYVVARDLGNLCKSYTDTRKSRFLLVSLRVETILGEMTIERRRNKLNGMGDGSGLADAYEATLERIKTQEGQKAKLAMATLMWICHSERPLQVDELCHALSATIGSTYFDNSTVFAVETLLTCCQGLITVDKEASTFRLIHHTLREYLSTDSSLFTHAHSIMAEACLTYLNSDQAKALPAKPQPDLSRMPFLKYCSRYWGTHAKRELSDRVMLLVMELLDRYENHVAANALFEQILEPDDLPKADAPSGFSGLHCASFFGIVDVMTSLLRMDGCDADRGDSAGITPLTWTVRGGHEGAVELLLSQEAVNPSKPDKRGRPPLWWASVGGHGSIVKQLLDRQDVNPNQLDNVCYTPLHTAAVCGHVSVVKQLLDRQDVNPDEPDDEGKTPLLWAAGEGHESVVKQLLGRQDVNPDKLDNEGKTPLSWAAIGGHELVVEQLLDRQDVNPDKPDNEGNTPLSWAAIMGHESVVKQLLNWQDVNPDTPNNEGKTPLSWAAEEGHGPVVKQLLDRQEVNPDKPDNEGKTPLSWAAIQGHESVAKQLSDQQNVNPDKPDNEGKTPLSWAAIQGHESVVKQLLDREDVDPTMPDKNGYIPLSYAFMRGHERVVNLLQAWKPPTSA